MKTILAIVLLTLFIITPAMSDGRRHRDETRGFPFSSEEHWDGYRTWKPDRRTRQQWPWPDRFTVDKPGKCEVRCVRSGRGEYKCREYRC